MWGANGIFVRLINVHATTLMFIDACLALVVMVPILFLTGRHKELASWRAIAITVSVAFLTTMCVLLLYRSMQLTTVSNAMLSHYTGPVFVFLFAPFFVQEKRTKVFAIALVASLIGLGVMMPMEDLSLANTNVVGLAVGIVSALFFAGSTIGMKKLTGQFSALVIVTTTFLSDLIFTAPFLIAQPAELVLAGQFWWLFLAKMALSTTIPFFLYVWGMRVVEAQRVSILGYIEPLAAIVLAAFFLSEIPGVRTLAGGLLILVSGAWIVIDGSVRQADLLVPAGEQR